MTGDQAVLRATGALRAFNEAGVLDAADVHVAQRLSRLLDEHDEDVLLGAALAVRAVRLGSVCLELAAAQATTGVEDADEETLARLARLRWPALEAWLTALKESAAVAVGADGEPDRPLRLVDGLLYLDRYWRQERLVATFVDERARRRPPAVDEARLRDALARTFPGADVDRQRLAAALATARWLTVIAGGPGTGKTTTVARMLAVLSDRSGGGRLRLALAAPTGRAAARLEEATRAEVARLSAADRARIGEVAASTIHRLLGHRPGSTTRFRHDRHNRLPYDVVVVDEASMVSLPLMARLMEAVRDDARLVLVGDPDQLTSVEAGAVLGDLVRRPAPADTAPVDVLSAVAGTDLAGLAPGEAEQALRAGVVGLGEAFRFEEPAIPALAAAVRAGDADAALEVLGQGGAVELTEDVDGVRRDVVETGRALRVAAEGGDADAALRLLDRHRLLCAHRQGPFGVATWSRHIEEWLADAVPGYARGGVWYVGRPLLVTANDHDLRLYNGDTGVVLLVDGQPRAAFRRGGAPALFAPHRLGAIQTAHALSVHRSQGSQFDAVTLVLPPPESRLMTRELLYTAITRARRQVRVVGPADAVRAAVQRRIRRVSGL